jgi:HAE1 family hydrophobic/amphiphilic exporter-1
LLQAASYGPIIIAYRNGNPVRLNEVAHVYDGVENDKAGDTFMDKPSIDISISKQPGTNVVQVVDEVKALLPSLSEQLPAALRLYVRSDRSQSIRDSVHDVKTTLLVTAFLVILVIFVFLRNVSATIIPSLALPASIVATFAVMYQLGYSLDNLSLMALTLSVGFVVDDAIVMLENIVRHMEMGKAPMRAALDGSGEVAFTIVAMTLSLTAVFIPVLFMGGVVGRLLHEFSVTIGMAILVSGFVSISLTPMLCSRFLKPPHTQRHGWLYNATERGSTPGAICTITRCAPRSDSALSRWPCRSCCSRPLCICSSSSRRAFCRPRIWAASRSRPRRRRASRIPRWSATHSKSPISSSAIRMCAA